MASPRIIGKYQLGECLGKGASAVVFKGLNLENGQTVAIKQIELEDLGKDVLNSILGEVQLMQTLDHTNIVKYLGCETSEKHLHLILEYVENGSLWHVLRKFGKFPEQLVRVYIRQVLEGLCYLHDQGVIHRDIKGANILTTKHGVVKLADFGLAIEHSEAGVPEPGDHGFAAGSPYWMAPEIIELMGASPKSDIWSVACTVVELLTGNPPYYDMDPMPALFKIAQEDSPPLPEGISPALRDFLSQCFVKNQEVRVSAHGLLSHRWIKSASAATPLPREVETDVVSVSHDAKAVTDFVAQYNEDIRERATTLLRMRTPEKPRGHLRRESGEETSDIDFDNTLGESLLPSQATSELLTGSSTGSSELLGESNLSEVNRGGDLGLGFDLKGVSISNLDMRITRTGERARTVAPTSGLSPLQHDDNEHMEETGGGEEFTRARSHSNATSPKTHSSHSSTTPLKTKKKSNKKKKKKKKKCKEKKIKYGVERTVSDEGVEREKIGINGDEGEDWDASLNFMTLQTCKEDSRRPSTARDRHPDSRDVLSSSTLEKKKKKKKKKKTKKPKKPKKEKKQKKEKWGKKNKNKKSPRREREGVTFSLPSGGAMDSSEEEEEEGGEGLDLAAVLVGKMSGSWNSGEDGQYVDPFAWDSSEEDPFDLDADLLKEQLVATSRTVLRLMNSLSTEREPSIISVTCDELVSLYSSCSPDDKAYLVRQHGVIPIMELLVVHREGRVVAPILRAVNAILSDSAPTKESFCMVGGIPAMLRFAGREQPNDIRYEVARFIQELTTADSATPTTLQMFVACQGIPVLVEFLEGGERKLMFTAIGALQHVFKGSGGSSGLPRNDMCRLCARQGLLVSLSSQLVHLAVGPSNAQLPHSKKALLEAARQRLLSPRSAVSSIGGVGRVGRGIQGAESTPVITGKRLFSPHSSPTVTSPLSTPGGSNGRGGGGELTPPKAAISPSQSKRDKRYSVLLGELLVVMGGGDIMVKAEMTRPQVVRPLVQSLVQLVDGAPKTLVHVVHALKLLSMEASVLDAMGHAGTIQALVSLLHDLERRRTSEHKYHQHILPALFNLGRINKERQEIAVRAGVIPLLQAIVERNSPLKQFALPILCAVVHVKAVREVLWKHDMCAFLVRLVVIEASSTWPKTALESIAVWLAADPVRVEAALKENKAHQSISQAFTQAPLNTLAIMLEPLLRILQFSFVVPQNLAKAPLFVERMVDERCLHHPNALVRRTLLRILHILYEQCEDRVAMAKTHNLPDLLTHIVEDDTSILVRDVAQRFKATIDSYDISSY